MLSVILSYGEMILADLQARRSDAGRHRGDSQGGERAAGLTRQLLMFSRQQVVEPKVLDLNEVLASMEKMLQRILGEDVELVVAGAERRSDGSRPIRATSSRSS